MTSRIEINSPGLRYVSIADDLIRQIESGEVQQGEKLPSQHEMAKQYGVSLTTLRSAVDLLEQRGFVRSAHGLGTFARAPEPGDGIPKILLVDDDPQMVELLTAILEGEDLLVTGASNVAEGIAELDAIEFRVVFLDLIMPGGSGIELLKVIEQHERKTPRRAGNRRRRRRSHRRSDEFWTHHPHPKAHPGNLVETGPRSPRRLGPASSLKL